MIEFIEAANTLTWPGAFAVGCACIACGIIGWAIFK